jgi:hypothetical protein
MATTMEEGDDAIEGWNDEVPEWNLIEPLNELDVLKDLYEVAEFFCSAPFFSFEGYPGAIEKDGSIEIHNIHLLEYENIILRLCKLDGELASMALVPKGRDSPQIILRPPSMIMMRSNDGDQ